MRERNQRADVEAGARATGDILVVAPEVLHELHLLGRTGSGADVFRGPC